MSLILKITKRNLSLSLPRQNYNGLITRLFTEELIMTILLTFRLNFSLSDYYFHRLSINFKTFKPAFVITTISWLTISILSSLIFWPNNRLLITNSNKTNDWIFETFFFQLQPNTNTDQSKRWLNNAITIRVNHNHQVFLSITKKKHSFSLSLSVSIQLYFKKKLSFAAIIGCGKYFNFTSYEFTEKTHNKDNNDYCKSCSLLSYRTTTTTSN